MSQWSITKRPRTLNDLYGLDNIKKYFYAKAKTKDWPKSVLLRGQFGNGKTTTAQIVAQMMVCQHPKPNGDPCGECAECNAIVNERFDSAVQMIDGGQAGKSDIVDIVTEFAYGSSFYPRRVMIIEEVQELSNAAKNSLLKILENPRPNVHFILLSMEYGATSGFASRSVPFNFRKVPVKELMLYMKSILETEGLWEDESIPKEFKLRGLATIAQVSNGSLRQAVQLLETCIIGKYFTADEIVSNLGIADETMVIDVLLKLCDADPDVWHLLEKHDPFDFFALGYKIVMDSAIYKASGYLPDEGNEFFSNNTKMLAAKKRFPALVDAFNSLAPNSKPFLRKAELLAALLPVYISPIVPERLTETSSGTGGLVGANCCTTESVPTRSVPVRTRS